MLFTTSPLLEIPRDYKIYFQSQLSAQQNGIADKIAFKVLTILSSAL